MSIVTLKRKTAANYNNASVGYKQFSLNGGYRNQGYVGQSVISRSLSRTLMRGSDVRGHGGCCGQYKVGAIVQSSINYQENPNVIKSSVINNNGMLINKYQCIGKCIEPMNDCTGCYKEINIVKPDNNNHNNTQGDHVMRKSKFSSCDHTFSIGSEPSPCPPEIAGLLSTPKLCKLATKPDYLTKKPMTEGEYITNRLIKKCVGFDAKPKAAINKTPFACSSKPI